MARQQFLLPELEPTAVQLAYLVGQLNAVEEEKAEANKDFKERIDLLKIQIKQAAKAINDSMEGGAARVMLVPEAAGSEVGAQ